MVADAIEQAAKRVGWEHPVVKEALHALLQVARAAPGFRGRYVGIRLSAYRDLLDRLALPPEPDRTPDPTPITWTFGAIKGVTAPARDDDT